MRPQIWSGLPARSPRRFRLERRFEIRDDKPISEIELRLVEKIGVVLCPRARGRSARAGRYAALHGVCAVAGLRLPGQANALCPVMCRPTMRDWISAVPS